MNIKPCPFCGAMPDVSEWRHGGVTYSAITCPTPHCILNPGEILNGVEAETETLIVLWNHRV